MKPLRILCQHDTGSCGACCGVYNFRDRSPEAEHARLSRRTALVSAAWPRPNELARVRDQLLEEERPGVLFAGVKVCPFAGYVEPGRVGCLLHPTRHPTGEDLRDLAVYPREICEGHFCAPHDWLRPREADLAQTVSGTLYGRVVTDAGLVKALAHLIDEALGRSWSSAELPRARAALDSLWTLIDRWPYRDSDPARFGGFVFSGNDAMERSLPSSLAGCSVLVDRHRRTVLDALGTRALTDVEARDALRLLQERLNAVAASLD